MDSSPEITIDYREQQELYSRVTKSLPLRLIDGINQRRAALRSASDRAALSDEIIQLGKVIDQIESDKTANPADNGHYHCTFGNL